jgi:hypothetical protein
MICPMRYPRDLNEFHAMYGRLLESDEDILLIDRGLEQSRREFEIFLVAFALGFGVLVNVLIWWAA